MTEVGPQLTALLGRPLIVAPMAGGVSTIALARAAGEVGSLAILAGGYQPPASLAEQIRALREVSDAPFGVNLFVPGRPQAAEIARLRAAGIHVMVTVTTADEARIAGAAGADSLCVQGPEAGGHRACFENVVGVADGTARTDGALAPGLLELLAEVRAVTALPLVGAGAVSTASDVAAVVRAGAVAAQVGTALLRSIESGAGEAYRAALADQAAPDTVVTRAFTGRPARAIRNAFTDAHGDAPAAYPEVNSITRPIRAAAAASGRTAALHLWAGTGFRQARKAPATEILRALTPADGRGWPAVDPRAPVDPLTPADP